MSVDFSFASLYHEFLVTLWPQSLQFIIAASPILLMLSLLVIFAELWVRYVRAFYDYSQKYTLLEIKLPKDTFKSPMAVEAFLNALHNGSDGNLLKQYWEGETRPWFSLEIISIEGQIKFIIWTQAKRRAFIEANLYAQIPGIEITEREDYARGVHFDPDTMKAWPTEFAFTKADPYPIKTYVDYGLDRDPKEEFKVDPLVPLLEFMGSIGYNQQLWIQILVQAHRKRKKAGYFFKKHDPYDEEAKKLVNDILKRDPKTLVVGERNEEGFPMIPKITKGEENVVEAIERAQTKLPFDVGIRAIYWGSKDDFNPSNIGGTIGSMKHFSSQYLNGFKPGGPYGKVEYPWQDYKARRENRLKKWAFANYKRRAYFHPPYVGKSMVMNTEELATLFHFPGQVAATPSLERVPSKKSQAPSNLPI